MGRQTEQQFDRQTDLCMEGDRRTVIQIASWTDGKWDKQSDRKTAPNLPFRRLDWFLYSFTFWELAKAGSKSKKGKDGKRDLILRWRARKRNLELELEKQVSLEGEGVEGKLERGSACLAFN